MDSVLKNFCNPWESDNDVLKTDVLDTSILNTDVTDNAILTQNQEDNFFPYVGRINTKGTGFHYQPRIATNIGKDYIRRDFEKGDLIYVRSETKKNWLKVERITMLGEFEEGYVDWRYVDTIPFADIGYVTEIAHSDREVGKNRAGTDIADDLKYGDMTTQELKNILGFFSYHADWEDDTLFGDLRLMCVGVFSSGELRKNILQMIDKFEKSEGGYYSSPIIDRKAQNHQSTISFFRFIEEVFHQKIKEFKGNPLRLFDNQLEIPDGQRPKYGTSADTWWGGLTIAINDTWAFNVYLTDYKQVKNKYEASIKVIIYDHFGLDTPDIATTKGGLYKGLAGFRAWFILQHHDERAYKPFITQITVKHKFSKNL